MPIRITTGGLTVSVVSSGMYRFYGDTAVVIRGKLRTADSSVTVKKGQEITSNGDWYEESKIPRSAGLDDFELWVGAARGAALRIEAAINRAGR